jgi:acetyl esterase/lipase
MLALELWVGVLAAIPAAGLAACYKVLRVDRDSSDYRRRIEFIWSSDIPNQPTVDQRLQIEADKKLVIRCVQHIFNSRLPRNGPYLLAYPVAAHVSPAVIIAPGGGYIIRAERHEGIIVAQWLNSIGVSAFVLNYRLDRHPAPLSDAQRAVQYVRAHASRLRIDPARVGIMGFSAGGHLAAMAGTMSVPGDPQAVDAVSRVSSRPDFMVLAYPVISFGELAHAPSKEMLAGPRPAVELLEKLSVERQVTAATPATFIWAARTDGMVDYRNAQVFADALARCSVPFELHLFSKGRHGTGLSLREESTKAWPMLCKKWLEKRGIINS